jgi:hypothetical protein
LLVATLLPITLHDVLARLPKIVDRLRRTEQLNRLTQRERFRRRPFLPSRLAA